MSGARAWLPRPRDESAKRDITLIRPPPLRATDAQDGLAFAQRERRLLAILYPDKRRLGDRIESAPARRLQNQMVALACKDGREVEPGEMVLAGEPVDLLLAHGGELNPARRETRPIQPARYAPHDFHGEFLAAIRIRHDDDAVSGCGKRSHEADISLIPPAMRDGLRSARSFHDETDAHTPGDLGAERLCKLAREQRARFAAMGGDDCTQEARQVIWRRPQARRRMLRVEQPRMLFRFRDYSVDGWSYQPPGIADFGENDRLRAAVALGGMAALGEAEAMYFHANYDASGTRLNGANSYRWRVPPGGVPVDAFWSLTMYTVTPEGRYFFVENPINRYSIGDRTPGLVVGPDGSFDILIQRQAPDGAMAANWLPAPEGPLRLALRAYLPRAQLRNRTWRVPPLATAS